MSTSKLIKCVTVGKTSMLICYTDNKFLTEYIPTVFDDFSAIVVLWLQWMRPVFIWHHGILQVRWIIACLSYRGADIFVLPFSLISRESYDNVLKTWMPELRRFASFSLEQS